MPSILIFAADVDPELQLLPDIAELVMAPIAFGLLFLVLWKFVFPRLNKVLEARRVAIQDQLSEAESARAEVAALRASQDEERDKARAEAARLIEEARAQAATVREDLVARAQAEADQIVAKAREDVAAERARLLTDLRGQVATLSVDLAGQIVQRELDGQRHRELVDSYIDQLSGAR